MANTEKSLWTELQSLMDQGKTRREALALLGFGSLALFLTACGLGGRRNPNSSPSATNGGPTTPEPTMTQNPDGALSKEMAQLRTQFEAGTTTATIDASTFPKGAEIVLRTNGGEIAYSYRTTPHGPWQHKTVQNPVEMVDWRDRENAHVPIISDPTSIVDKMSTIWPSQQVLAGRPVGVEHLTATLIEVAGQALYNQSTNSYDIIPIPGSTGPVIGFMFNGANLTPSKPNLG
ncbi:MAG TPA: hypothetical protein VFQ63_01775 [Patescibacteria group bacterium]|nr:hypothetical protein [Patescibacteria group bacterium]